MGGDKRQCSITSRRHGHGATLTSHRPPGWTDWDNSQETLSVLCALEGDCSCCCLLNREPCSNSTLHSLLLLQFSAIKVLYHHYCSSVGIHEKQIQIWSIRFDNDQFEGSVCEPVSCVGCDDVSRFCASVAPNYDRGPVSLVLALFLLVLCVA